MKKRNLLAFTLALVLVLTLFGCSAGSTSDSNGLSYESAEVEMDMEMETQAALTDNGSVTTGSLSENRKWVITIDMSAETEDLDTLLAGLDEQITALKGYVESRNIYNGSAYSNYRRYRSASLTVRIPADQVDQFTAHMADAANVIYSNQTLDDITLSYVSTESRLNALTAEETRLLELMAQAEDMSDLLEIESRLTEVRYELENVTSRLRVYDNQVDYATIYLDISEVQEYTVVEEQTVWQRIGTGFVSSLKGVGNFLLEVVVFLVTKLPYILLIAIALVVVVLVIRKKRKKRKES